MWGTSSSLQQVLLGARFDKGKQEVIILCLFPLQDDHTRVLLNPIEGIAGSDYINANFIDVS